MKSPREMRRMLPPEDVYREAGVEIENAVAAVDSKGVNKAIGRMVRAAKQIRLTHSDGGEAFFASFLKCESPHVVCWSAFFLIPLNPTLARATFERLERGRPGEIRVSAKMTLQEWDAGRLDPEWFMKK